MVQDVGDTEHKLVSQVMVILNSINRFDPSSVAATGAERFQKSLTESGNQLGRTAVI